MHDFRTKHDPNWRALDIYGRFTAIFHMEISFLTSCLFSGKKVPLLKWLYLAENNLPPRGANSFLVVGISSIELTEMSSLKTYQYSILLNSKFTTKILLSNWNYKECKTMTFSSFNKNFTLRFRIAIQLKRWYFIDLFMPSILSKGYWQTK